MRMIRPTLLWVWVLAILPAASSLGGPPGLPGDVTLDGEVNVLDVQAGIGEALGALEPTPEADINSDGALDIRDVQHLINSALRVGGVFQVVEGRLGEGTPGVKVVAVSESGLQEVAEVEPDSGEFVLTLRVGTSWTIGLLDEVTGAIVGSLGFPVGGNVSVTLPMPELSSGAAWDLGELYSEDGTLRIDEDLVDIVGASEWDTPISGGEVSSAFTWEGVDPLFEMVTGDLAMSVAMVFADEDGRPEAAQFDLADRIVACANADGSLAGPVEPGPIDVNGNEVPDVFQGIVDCLAAALPQWLDDNGVPEAADTDEDGIPDAAEAVVARVLDMGAALLEGFDTPGREDVNDDGVPDWFEDFVYFPSLPEDVDPIHAHFLSELVINTAWAASADSVEPMPGGDPYDDAMNDLAVRLVACANADGALLEPPEPDSGDENGDLVPDAYQGIADCLYGVLPVWLDECSDAPETDEPPGTSGISDEAEMAAREAVDMMVARLLESQELEGMDAPAPGYPEIISLPATEELDPAYASAISWLAMDVTYGIPLHTDPYEPLYVRDSTLSDLAGRVVTCANADGALAGPVDLDLADDNGDGIPNVFQGTVDCLIAALPEWLEEYGVAGAQYDGASGVPDNVRQEIDFTVESTIFLLHDLGLLPCEDGNHNGLPDCIEDYILVPGITGDGIDADQNGIPDWIDDEDQDGVPNMWDYDVAWPGDLDRDGVPDEFDVDSDNDGVPDYCDVDPLDPEVTDVIDWGDPWPDGGGGEWPDKYGHSPPGPGSLEGNAWQG